MKKLSIVLLFFIILSNLFSQQLELEKINDTMISQFYLQKDNVIADEGYLYTLSAYGLEIYEIGNNGELNPQSRMPITVSNSIEKKDNYIYISSGKLSASDQWGKLYQINVVDKQNPVIEQELDLDYFSWPLEVYGNILNIRMYNVATIDYYNHFYLLPDLSLIAQHQSFLNVIDKLNDTTAIRHDIGLNQFTVFDISDPVNPVIIGSGDVSSQHQYNISRVINYNDTILIFTDNDFVSFWNVSDWYNWEYITQYQPFADVFLDYKPLVIGSVMILVEDENVELVELADINNPQQLFILSGTANHFNNFALYIASYNDNLYVTTNHNGIQRFKLIDNTLSFENEYAEFYPSKPVQHDDYLIAPHYVPAFQYFDFTNPTTPIDFGEFIPNYYPLIALSEERLAAFNHETYDYDIYNISNINDPTLANQIELDNYHKCRFGNTDNNSVYFTDDINDHLKKYDVSQPGICELIFDEDLTFHPIDWLLHNDYGYFLEYVDTYIRRLYIYEGLETNQPTLCNTIENFVSNPGNSFMKIVDGLLAVYTIIDDVVIPANHTRFFDISIPDQPAFAFSVDAFGKPFIKDDLVFTATYYKCYVFEKPDVPTGAVEPIYIFNEICNINNIYFIEYNNVDYLLLCQASHVGVYSYEYTPSAADDDITITPDTLSNHPNPFNPETKIAFNIPESGKVKVEIFNVKGQKIRTLIDSEFMEKGNHSIIWNGTDENNQQVSTGVYLYQLEVDGKPLASKKMLLLR
jgi:hypothetical protein